MLQGRRRERELLERQLERARRGQSAVLVFRGEAGIGKTSLLEYVAERASGWRVAAELACGFGLPGAPRPLARRRRRSPEARPSSSSMPS